MMGLDCPELAPVPLTIIIQEWERRRARNPSETSSRTGVWRDFLGITGFRPCANVPGALPTLSQLSSAPWFAKNICNYPYFIGAWLGASQQAALPGEAEPGFVN